MIIPEKKICFQCQEESPIGNFYKATATADGFNIRCKPCYKARYNDNRLARGSKEDKETSFDSWLGPDSIY